MFANINYLAVAVAAFAHLVVGALWYSPFAFGPMWSQEVKTSGKPGAIDFVSEFVLGLIMAGVLACFLGKLHVDCLFDAMKTAFWVWLGFVATVQYSGVIWAKKSIRLFTIEAGAMLVSLLLVGAVLGFLR